jgi:hypothetical protein
VTSGSASGLSTLQPLADPNNPDFDGLTFTPPTGVPASFGCSMTIPTLTVSGNWLITQPEMSAGKGCASSPLLAAANIEPSDANLDKLRQLRSDLLSQGGAMGKWYVDQYNTYQPDLNSLTSNQSWLDAVSQYSGNQIWADILAAIGTASASLSPADAQNAIALVSAAQNISTNEDFVNTIGEILGNIGDYEPSAGGSYTYAQILTIIAGETPPDSTTDLSTAAQQKTVARAAASSPLEPFQITQSWSGTFTATALNASGTAQFSIAAGEGGAAPSLTCTSFTISIPTFSFTYAGDDLASKLEVFLQQTFDPSATSGIGGQIQSAVNSGGAGSLNESIVNGLTSVINTAVQNAWPPD